MQTAQAGLLEKHKEELHLCGGWNFPLVGAETRLVAVCGGSEINSGLVVQMDKVSPPL